MPRIALIAVILCLLTSSLWSQSSRTMELGGREYTLQVDDSLVVAGYRSRFNLDWFLAYAGPMVEAVREHFVDRRTVVLKAGPKAQGELLQELRRHPDILFAHPVMSLSPDGNRRGWYLLTHELVAYFHGTPTVNEIQADLDRVGAELAAPIAWLPGAFLLRVGAQGDALKVSRRLAALRRVAWAHPNWLRFLGPRQLTVPNDPLFANLWHLSNTGQGGGTPGADIRAIAAWNQATGTNRTIAVIDTGVESNHPDLAQTSMGYNPLLGAGATTANDTLGHGTRCAGVAAAIGNNSNQLCGIAWNAKILPVRLLDGSGFGTPTDEASCFIWATDNGADIITNSWGPDGVPFPLPALVDQSFAYATSMGRNGLGCPIFWAAGNGNEPIGPDQYVASPFTIAVGATDNFDLRSSYSDYGVELDIMAPSSGGTRAINTTDLNGGTTLNFGGTSSAAPLAAGVAALMLEAAPGLNWVQVRDILRNSADKVQPIAAGYNSTGHSLLYGYGRLNADQAVQDALATNPAPLSLTISTTGVGDIIVDLRNMGPFNVWVIGFSSQIFSPIGSGPIYGVGIDALQTIFMPFGVIPFHYMANSQGNFYWGATGLPAGLTLQAVAFEIRPDYSFRPSNVIQVTF